MLKDVIPVTASGEKGLIHILDETNVQKWVEDNVETLVAEGYATLRIVDHVYTKVVGDRLRGHKPTRPS